MKPRAPNATASAESLGGATPTAPENPHTRGTVPLDAKVLTGARPIRAGRPSAAQPAPTPGALARGGAPFPAPASTISPSSLQESSRRYPDDGRNGRTKPARPKEELHDRAHASSRGRRGRVPPAGAGGDQE